MLEKRLDKQATVTQQVIRQQAAYPGPSGPYEPPMPWDKKFHLNGITLTPGGFIAAEGVWRDRDQGADIGDAAFGSIPALNSPARAHEELRFTARQSRVSMLVQGDYNPDVLISGYGELDFLGAANTANSNESNSYTPRIRHMYATIDWKEKGLHLLGGQTWSLATMQGKGISPRNEVIPLTIDAQYVAGFTWTRQPGLRVTKNFGNDIWSAASAEKPQTTGFPDVAGVRADRHCRRQCQSLHAGPDRRRSFELDHDLFDQSRPGHHWQSGLGTHDFRSSDPHRSHGHVH